MLCPFEGLWVRLPLFWLFLSRPRPRPLFPQFLSNDIPFTSGNGVELVRQDQLFLNRSSLFCLTTRRHDVSSKYFWNLRFWYCYCKSIFEAWNVLNVYFNMSSSAIFSPHNLNCEVILNSAELWPLHSYGAHFFLLVSSIGLGDLFLWGTQFLIPHGQMMANEKSLSLPDFVWMLHCHL